MAASSSTTRNLDVSDLRIRPTEDFKTLPLPRPGGSSFDVQIFEEISSRKRWIGKCDQQAASHPHARLPYKARYYDEYKEWLGFKFYELCDIPVPNVALSIQRVVKPVGTTADMEEDYDYVNPCLHIMSEFVDGFQTCGVEYSLYVLPEVASLATTRIDDSHAVILIRTEAVVTAYFVEAGRVLKEGEAAIKVTVALSEAEQHQLRSGFGKVESTVANRIIHNRIVTDAVTMAKRVRAEFLTYYKQAAKSQKAYVTLPPSGYARGIPLKGFGAALAVADFIYDGDCVGRGGKNIGYVVEQDAKSEDYAKVVKIDTGCAFSFLEDYDDKIYEHKASDRAVRLAPGKENNQIFALHYDELCEADQKEFVQTARKILALPWVKIETLVRQVVCRDGFSANQAQTLLTKLLDRKLTFLNAFYPEVAGQLDEEARALRRQVQAEREQVLLQWLASNKSKVGEQKTEQNSEEKQTDLNITPESKEVKRLTPVASSSSSFRLSGFTSQAQTVVALQSALSDIRRLEQSDRKAPAQCRTFQLPTVTAHFTGRVNDLQQLATRFQTRGAAVISQAVKGLGGVGKTQLAARYAELARSGTKVGTQTLAYDAILWLYAERDLMSQAQGLAESWFGIKGLSQEETLAAIGRQFARQRVLVIFDNAEDPALLMPWLNVFRGGSYHILITSRQASWGEIPMLSLNGFSEAEGIAYVQKHLPTALPAEIKALLTTVAYLPLALAHAVAYVQAGFSSLADYPQVFARHQLSLTGSATVSESGQTVMTTFLLTLKKLLASYPAIDQLLEACAYLSPEGIPVSLLAEGLKENLSPEEFKRSLTVLQQHSLLESTNPETVNIHRLVQGTIRSYHQQVEGPVGVEKHLTHWVRVVTKILKYNDKDRTDILRVERLIPQAWAIGESAEPIVAKDVVVGHLFHRIGHHQHYAKGAYAAGYRAFTRALKIHEAHYPADHPDIAKILVNLADTLRTLGDAQGAKPLLERALKIKEAHYPANHPEIAVTLVNLANTLRTLGNAQGAKPLFERVLKIFETHYPADHPNIAVTLVNLANTLNALGDAQEAKPLLERALKIDEAHYPADHPSIAIALGNLANTLRTLDDAQRAKPLLERALKIKEAHYPTDHPEIAIALGSLANTLGDLGDAQGAKHLLERALKIKEAHYSAGHPTIAVTLVNLAAILRDLGDAQGAKPLLERALKIDEAHYPVDHPEIAIALVNLALTLRALGNAREAKPLAERAHRIFLKEFGPEHPRTKFAADTLAKLSALPTVNNIESKASESSSSSLTLRQQYLGEATCLFVNALEAELKNQLTTTWDKNAAASFIGGIVGALGKGNDEYKARMNKPEDNAIPQSVADFISRYMAQHPQLLELSQETTFAGYLKRELYAGRYNTLRQRFNTSTTLSSSSSTSSTTLPTNITRTASLTGSPVHSSTTRSSSSSTASSSRTEDSRCTIM